MQQIVRFIKNWTLPISMFAGVAGYFVYSNLPFLACTKPLANETVGYIQPLLIFSMLFLTFCKVKPSDLHFRTWYLWLSLIQTVSFGALAMILHFVPDTSWRLIIESAMLCLICPTATAGAVVTMKLGGNAASLTTYTIFINLVVAIVIPLLVPIAHPQDGITFLPAFLLIIRKVFPLLICPLLAAWIVRYCLPKIHEKLLSCKDLAFYLWAVALAIAIAVTCKALVHSHENFARIAAMAATTLICCLLQFYIGRKIGARYGERIEGGQSIGQKNTVFIIWLGYTFMTPVTAISGGLYSIWHNTINSYQLWQKRKSDQGK
ncbi:MAG: transporter [Paludibacteraceae bacterium]|nr:transporter [Paludibacteraceae bacterium]MBR6309749.1 transporter [Paludibacteraceae bacterium]